MARRPRQGVGSGGLDGARSADGPRAGVPRLRYHFAADLDEWVERFLGERDASPCAELAARLEDQSYHLRMTRDFFTAAGYLRTRYRDDPDARFGVVASSRDKDLVNWNIRNDYFSVEKVRRGPWYAEGDDDPRSCRHLRDCLTEFKTQGLELDGVLLAWGTDLARVDDEWSIRRAKGYQRGTPVKDPYQLRVNAYRVLLTRGRACTLIYVPPMRELDETAAWLQRCGIKMLD